ncbi:MAG: hypothetical protein IPN29_11555 [Saprospiraceae bacterium]|nr:hypothetical protein [Saprospiraceae bacterium]
MEKHMNLGNDVISQRALLALDDFIHLYPPKECTDHILSALKYINLQREDEVEPMQFLTCLASVFHEIEYPEGDPGLDPGVA